MHQFPNKSVIRRLRIAAGLFILRCILPVFGFPLLMWSMLVDDMSLFFGSLWILVGFVVVMLAQWLVALSVRCPLCYAAPLVKSGCVKSRKAERMMSSYRLEVSRSVFVNGHFRCPYCGEPSVLSVRQRVLPGQS